MKKSRLDSLISLAKVAKVACDAGERHKSVLLPGYTHMQRAMPSTVGFWYASFAEGFADSIEAGMDLYRRVDRSPLGAAAGFGVPIPLDRAYTAEAMGFSAVHVNAAAVQNSRGRFEASLANWFVEVGRDVEKMAWDLLLFSTAEFGFVKIPETLVTGSSIMPQKKNPDVVELLRAAPSVLRGCRDEIERIIEKLPSNYHRDFQLTKGPLIRAVNQGGLMIAITQKLLEALTWQPDKLKAAFSIDLLATHRAVDLVKSGMPFREAYLAAAKELETGDTANWQYTDQEILDGLSHLGAPGNPGLTEARARIDVAAEKTESTRTALFEKWDGLIRSK
jgi:argininosuccinate lyase